MNIYKRLFLLLLVRRKLNYIKLKKNLDAVIIE